MPHWTKEIIAFAVKQENVFEQCINSNVFLRMLAITEAINATNATNAINDTLHTFSNHHILAH